MDVDVDVDVDAGVGVGVLVSVTCSTTKSILCPNSVTHSCWCRWM